MIRSKWKNIEAAWKLKKFDFGFWKVWKNYFEFSKWKNVERMLQESCWEGFDSRKKIFQVYAAFASKARHEKLHELELERRWRKIKAANDFGHWILWLNERVGSAIMGINDRRTSCVRRCCSWFVGCVGTKSRLMMKHETDVGSHVRKQEKSWRILCNNVFLAFYIFDE